MRIGIGYDVHPFAEDRPLILGGVKLPFDKGLAGHSDADVLLHAIADAILGAAAMGDIGQHFPDTNPDYANFSSLLLLKDVAAKVRKQGFRILNVDATLVLERPKIAPHVERMRKNISQSLGVPVQRISVKATTSEQLGFVGRQEGVAAQAVALLAEEE